MTTPSVAQSSRSMAALNLQQDDQITPIAPPLAEQVRPSSTPLVPYHFGGNATNNELKQQLQTKQARLKSEIAKLGKLDVEANPLDFARAHMALEGKVLESMPGASFQDVQLQLAELGRPPHPMLSGQAENAAFTADLNEYLSQNEGDRKDAGGFKAVWDKQCQRVGNTLGAYHSLYQEAIGHAEGDTLGQVQSSHKAFRGYAQGVMKTMTQEMPQRLGSFLQSRIEHADAAANNAALPQAARDSASDQAQQLREAQEELGLLLKKDEAKPSVPSKLEETTKKHAGLDTALKNVAREDYVGKLKEESGDLMTGLAVFAGGSIAQGPGASMWHFGYTSAAIDERMAQEPFAAHIAATASGLGLSHKVVSDGLRPFVQLLVDKTVGAGVAKANPMAVYPKPLEDVTVNGRRVANPQFEALGHTQAEKRSDYVLTQNANNFGTMSGDFTGFSAFGGAHAVRDLLDQFTSLNGGSIHARAVASAVGGAAMAGGHAVAKYAQTHGDEKIPTYQVTRETRGWAELATKARDDALTKLNPISRENASDLANRILSLGEGVALRTAVGNAAAAGEDASVGDKLLQTFATYVSSGLTLFPFFANNPSAPIEAKALGGGKDDLAKRANVPLQNILHPNRASLAHTQPEGWRRTGENAIHMARGVTQVIPQGVVAGVNASADGIKKLASKKKTDTAGSELDLAERGQLPRRGNPPGK